MKIGSSVSTMQLQRSVIEGRKVRFHFQDGVNALTGYVWGMDDYHWLLVTPEGDKHLVHKGSVPVVDLISEATYHEEPNHRELENLVAPFRTAIEKDHKERTASKQRR